MAYKRPGVYITESLTPLLSGADSSGGSTGAFVAASKQGGPVLPTFVRTWGEYVTKFGDFGDGADLLPYAVFEYFNNGGSGCYIVRAANADATVATKLFKDTTAVTPIDVLKVTAVAPGAWGNDIKVDVVASAGRFDLFITLGKVVERYVDLSLDPADMRCALNIINSPHSGSLLVDLEYMGPAVYTAANAPAAALATHLAAGTEGTGTPDLLAATKTLELITTPLDVNLPGVNAPLIINPILLWAAEQQTVFVVVDGIMGQPGDTAADNATAQLALVDGTGTAITACSGVAIYGPWMVAEDPSSMVPGASRLLPPGGFVLGQYAKSDVNKGVQKVPAGTSTTLRGVLQTQFKYTIIDLDLLNPVGINVIRAIPSHGICIWGARTTLANMPDRYINIRRLLIYLKYLITRLSRPALFEQNDPDLWAYLTEIIAKFLLAQWQAGVLQGKSPAQAFYIQCDELNNPTSSANLGIVNIEIGLALISPAEFIVINIGQSLTGQSIV